MNEFRTRHNILVVDNDVNNQLILQHTLESNYYITLVNNAKDALELLSDPVTPFSLVILNTDTPGMTGSEFLEIRTQDESLKEIPVIVITSGKESEAACLRQGADDFIRRPFEIPEVILVRCERIIDLHENRNLISQTERDKISGLYTRDYFFEYLNQILPYDTSSDRDATVIDIEHFRLINEIYGRGIGNTILTQIGKFLRQKLPQMNAIACRAGADVFYLYCIHQDDYQDLQKEIQKLVSKVANANNIRVRIGTWQFIDRKLDPETWFDRAKKACDRINGNYTVSVAQYSSELHNKHLYEELLIHDIHEAIEKKHLKVYYQPKYSIQGAKPHLRSCEALIRWIHPTKGFINPGDFIPLFESNGLIQMVDYYVWSEAAAQVRQWKETYDMTVPVSVNVSRIDIYDSELENKLCDIARQNGLTSEEFMIEITESAYSDNAQGLIEVLERLQKRGFHIEMDDFGTGYSSLSMLTELPIDILKIDMSFVRNMEKNERNRKMVELIVDIAKFLKVPSVAEGVETETQLQALKKMGCDVIQGYYFSKPVPPEEFSKFIIKEKSMWTN